MTSLFRGRNILNDAFSEFRKYISPTYYHDRCERSLNMNLYTMHKRDVLLILARFLATFILLLFIGLAGPNVTEIHSIKPQDLFKINNVNDLKTRERLLETGPFILDSHKMTVYSEHLCLWVTIYLKEEDETEAFHKQFFVSLRITAKDEQHREQLILNENQINLDHKQKYGRVHKLICVSKRCNPIEILHLDLEFNSYTINITFQDLHTINEKYHIKDILFTFQSINSSFTNLTIWFRFFFLVTSFICTCWFTYSLPKYNFVDWTIEQKFIAILLVLLSFFNNPFYPMVYLFGSKLPRLMEIIFQNNFFLLLIFFWLTFYHGIRQNNRSIRFYAPKILLIGSMWLIFIYSFNWAISIKLEKPTIDEQLIFDDSLLLKLLKVLFYTLFFVTFVYLVLLMLAAFSELRSMPYFDLRLKLQTFLIIFVTTIFVLISVLSSSGSPKEINELDIPKISYLQILPWTYENSSSASFLAIYSLANLYIVLCAYFYSPSFPSFPDSRIIRDNPTLSMINDSDEDIIFNMDLEDDP